MNIQVAIGDVSVCVEDDSEPNLDALESVLSRCSHEALKMHTILELQARAAEIAAAQLEAE